MKHMKQWKKMQKVLLAAAFAVIVLGVLPVSANAATKLKTVHSWKSKGTTFAVDLTGDKKNEKVTLKETKSSDGYVSKMQIKINKKTALTLKNTESFYTTIIYFQMSSSRQFLQIYGTGDNDTLAYNRIYRYNKKTGKLVRVLNLGSYKNANAYAVKKVTKNTIKVNFSYQPSETGTLKWKYTYTYKNGKFRLKSSTAAVKSGLSSGRLNDGYDDYFRNNQFVAAKRLQFYTTTARKTLSFTVKQGDVVTLKNIRLTGNNIYLQFQSGTRTGWQLVNRSNVYDYTSANPGVTGWFHGVYSRLAG